jgi:hypothetical protein
MAAVSSLFMFVQFEFTHAIGPGAGRYVVAPPEALPGEDLNRRERLTGVTMKPSTADVLAITLLSAAPARRQPLRRRARAAESEAPVADVPLLLVTFIRSTAPLSGEREANSVLDSLASDEAAQQKWVDDGLAAVNRAIRAYRAGAGDPYVTEVAQRDARAVRIGFGSTEDVASGRFHRALTLPPPAGHRPTRVERLAPAEITADFLAGRGDVLESEDVLLRAYADLDHGRLRAATQQVRAALALLELELGGDLDALRAAADGLVERAAREPGDTTAVAELEQVIQKVVAVIERWRYAELEA